jgi:hypothetical protein
VQIRKQPRAAAADRSGDIDFAPYAYTGAIMTERLATPVQGVSACCGGRGNGPAQASSEACTNGPPSVQSRRFFQNA